MNASPSPPVWVVRAGRGGTHVGLFEKDGVVAIGFPDVGDATGKSREELFEHARVAVGSRAGNQAGQVDAFARRIQSDDLVIVPDGGTRELVYGRVTGGYGYRSEAVVDDYHHVRSVQWLGRRDRDQLADRVLYSLGSLLTVFQPAHQELLARFLLTGKSRDPAGSEVTTDDEGIGAAEQEARNRELITKQLKRLGPYETQALVAEVLRALGYQSVTDSPPGEDGGIDVLASRDVLSLHALLKVQVKARPETKISPDVVRQLNGLVDLAQQERGIVVSTGGFTDAAKREAERMKIQLWDSDRLTELYLEAYERLSPRVRDRVPLRRIWALDRDASD